MRCQSYCSAASVTCWWWASSAEWQIPTLQYHVIYSPMEAGGELTNIRQKAQPPIHPNPLLSADDFSIPFQLREFFPNFPITQVQKESNYFSKIAFLVVICENTTLCYAVHVWLVKKRPSNMKSGWAEPIGGFWSSHPSVYSSTILS